MPPFGHRQETVRRASGVNGVDSHFDGSVGAVFKSDRAGQTGRELTMHLRLRGPRANRAPAHQIGKILRRDHIEEFPRRGQPAVVDIKQQLARDTQAIVDAEAVIHMRIVDQPFPADGGTRFLKINAHHDFQLAF